MLSVLIACYNQRAEDLVIQLWQQGRALNRPFEIIVHENGHDLLIQQSMQAFFAGKEEIRYAVQRSANNRSASRNWMAKQARFPYLLFMDGDAAVVDQQFLYRYIQCLPSQAVWVGGTAYRAEPPAQDRLLRWTYGKGREERKANSQQPKSAGFSSFNFLMPRSAFEKVQFDETITAYGHEDSLLGQQLLAAGISIRELQNPLYHEGLDHNQEFLAKSAEAVRTLAQLVLQDKLGEEIKLYRTYRRLTQWKLAGVMRSILLKARKMMERQLCSKKPSMLVFDLWKLGHLLEEMQKKKTPPKRGRGLRANN